MNTLTYLANRPDEVLEALRHGQITALETATEQLTDMFLLYALESGLLDKLAANFPDPRVQQPEISMRILLAAGIAGHFAGLYALSQSPYALHSPRLLTELGIQVALNQPGEGLSRKGTRQAAPFHGDVARKLLTQLATHDTENKEIPGQSLLDWYNAHVGAVFCQTVGAQPLLHILDCTDLTVNLHNDRYEQSGVSTKNSKEGKCPPERGYKLATLRSLLDTGALLTSIAWGSIEQNDVVVTHELVRASPPPARRRYAP